jgi:hypothetical protein
MGLKRWDQPNDLFSYVELSDNFALLDVHDHSSGKGVQIPTAGIVNNAIDATKLADNAVTATKVAAGALADTKLASPNNAVWKTLAQVQGSALAGLIAQRYYVAQGGALQDGLSTAGVIVPVIPINPTWYAVAGKTTQLRLLTTVVTNATAPASNFTFGLYPITSTAGGATGLSYTGGTVVAGSTALHTAPAANARSFVASAAFAPPAFDSYAIGYVTSATLAASSFVNTIAYLQVQHV